MQNIIKCLFVTFFIPLVLLSQNSIIQGVIYDEGSKESIPMVNIVLKSNNNIIQGAVSNINGEYSLTFQNKQNNK